MLEVHRDEAQRAFDSGGFDGLKEYVEGLLDQNAINHLLVATDKA